MARIPKCKNKVKLKSNMFLIITLFIDHLLQITRAENFRMVDIEFNA